MDAVIEAERKATEKFEAETVAARIDGHNYSIADLRKVFDAVCNPEDWKAPWAAFVPHQIVPVVMASVEFFHADRPTVGGIQPLTGKVSMMGKGYQAY